MSFFDKFRYRFYYVEREKRPTDGLLNGNAFKNFDDKLLADSKKRLGIFFFHSLNIKNIIEEDKKRILELTRDPRTSIEKLSENTVREGLVAIYDGVSYQVSLHGILYSLKSFLDIYAFFITKLIDNKTKGMAFSEAKVKASNQILSGGRLINWVDNLSKNRHPYKDKLSSVITRHSKDWVGEAVKYRDHLTHYRDIPGFVDLHIVAYHTKPYIRENRLEEPTMPDGVTLVKYADQLRTNLISFIKETAECLPNVDLTKLSYDLDNMYSDNVVIRIETDDDNESSGFPRVIRRNDQCPCGSGAKYKKCCGSHA